MWLIIQRNHGFSSGHAAGHILDLELAGIGVSHLDDFPGSWANHCLLLFEFGGVGNVFWSSALRDSRNWSVPRGH